MRSGPRVSFNSLPTSFANPQPFRRHLWIVPANDARGDGEHYKRIDAGVDTQVAHHYEDAETKDSSRDCRALLFAD